MKAKSIQAKPVLPNFLIVGAGKSGTTSLYYYLKRHSDIFMSPVKEPKFFSGCSERPGHGPGDALKAIVSVPMRINADLRPSKLIKSIPSYIIRSIVTIVRIFIVYRPFRFFGSIGVVLFGSGILIGMRFMWFYLNGHGNGHMQSLILASVLIGMGFQTLLIAVIADLLSANRKLLEDVRYQTRRTIDNHLKEK